MTHMHEATKDMLMHAASTAVQQVSTVYLSTGIMGHLLFCSVGTGSVRRHHPETTVSLYM